MLNISKKWTLLAIAAVSAGCAYNPKLVDARVVEKMHRVSAISMVSDELQRRHVGFTMFTNEIEDRSISEWNLDSKYENQIKQAAVKVLGAEAVDIQYSRAKFAHVNDPDGPYDAPAFWGPNFEKIEADVKDVCTANSLDALFVVGRRKSHDLFDNTTMDVAGIGIYTHTKFNSSSLLHYLATVALYDCATAKVVATRLVATYRIQADGSKEFDLTVKELPESLSRVAFKDWTPVIEKSIYNEILNLPAQAWESTMMSMIR